MAAIRPSDGHTRPASARHSTTPATPKLRDSCITCAASKVKCDKQKPTCARCAKRSLACEYCVTKRAGRKHDTRTSGPKNATRSLPGSTSSTSTSSETLHLTPPDLIQPSPWQQHTSSYQDLLPDLLSPPDSAFSSTSTDFSTNFDDFFASPISFAFPEPSPITFTQPYIDTPDINNGVLDSDVARAFDVPEDVFSVIDGAVSDAPTPFKPCFPSSRRPSTTSSSQSFQGSLSDASCCCLIRALGLLKQLSPNASTACTISIGLSYENVSHQIPAIQSVVAENEQTIEAISSMLQCPCSQDGYLLAIMSLIVFKVLGWYAAAAHGTSVIDDNQNRSKSRPHQRQDSFCHSEQGLRAPAVMNSYCADGEDPGRMAAQLVLRELHRVQRIVNLLSQRLKSHGTHDGVAGPLKSGSDGQYTLFDREGASSFSAPLLDQLVTDLRKRLRTISGEIVDMLRQG